MNKKNEIFSIVWKLIYQKKVFADVSQMGSFFTEKLKCLKIFLKSWVLTFVFLLLNPLIPLRNLQNGVFGASPEDAITKVNYELSSD